MPPIKTFAWLSACSLDLYRLTRNLAAGLAPRSPAASGGAKWSRTIGLKLTCVSVIGLFLAVGCDTVKAPGAAEPDPLPASAYPQIAALGGLDGYLAYDKPVVNRPADRPMNVSVPIRLKSDAGLKTQYRFIFFDQNGRPLEPDPTWQFTFLPARAQAFLEGSALDTDAVDWRLEVRPSLEESPERR